MRNLLNYILRNSAWFLAFLLFAFSIYLVFKHNSYQRSVYLSSANKITGEIYRISNDVSSFFHLKSNNQKLLERAAKLEEKVQLLQTQVETLLKDTSALESFTIDSIQPAQFKFI